MYSPEAIKNLKLCILKSLKLILSFDDIINEANTGNAIINMLILIANPIPIAIAR